MEAHHFFLMLMAVLLGARVFGEIAARLKVPPVIGEMLAGVALGPSLLGWLDANETIRLLAEIGIILLLFEVGLETDLHRLARSGTRALLVACTGVAVPFVLGYLAAAHLFGLPAVPALFVGGTLTATSIGITVRVLADLRKQDTDEAQIVLGAAVIDDIIGVLILALLYQFSQSGSVSLGSVGRVTTWIAAFLVLAPVAAKLLSVTIRRFDRVSTIPGLIPTTMVSILLFFAWAARLVGAPQLLGGFTAGLALTRRFFLPFGAFLHAEPEFAHRIESQMKPIVHVFTPIFFVVVGLSLDLRAVDWGSARIWALTGAILAAAVLGKLASGLVLLRDPARLRWAVGIAMIPRGEVGLIFAELGRSSGIFGAELYAAMLLVIACTTLLTPFVMRAYYAAAPAPGGLAAGRSSATDSGPATPPSL